MGSKSVQQAGSCHILHINVLSHHAVNCSSANTVLCENSQPQQDSNQWGGAAASAAAGGYYGGYGQGYDAYGGGYAQPQDPNMYGYGAYAGYPNYQQQPAAQQPQQQQVSS